MSLVAYGSSDESDSNDEVDENTTVPSKVANNEVSQKFNAPENGAKEESPISDEEEDLNPRKTDIPIESLLKDLPAPRGQGHNFVSENDELEDEVKPKAAELEMAPKPPPKKARQPVKITIPALPIDDDDEEDGGPAKKKIKPASTGVHGKSGLTALLPAPIHAAKKETNRILLPHSLGKRSQPASAAAKPAPRTPPVLTNLPQYDSDSDDAEDQDGTCGPNFFSLTTAAPSVQPDRSDPPSEPPGVPEGPSAPVGPSLPERPSVPVGPSVAPGNIRTSLKLPDPHNTQLPALPPDTGQQSSGSTFGTPVDPNAPLTFKGGRFSHSSQSSAASSDQAMEGLDSNQTSFYNMPYDGSCSYPEVTDTEAFQHDQEFLKMQGKKQRGKEAINIVEVNADDYTDPTELSKHLSEETYRPQNKEDQPTQKQKRKHQIQFLAFEAKERELELKNTWSNNKMSKRQTQAKYGF